MERPSRSPAGRSSRRSLLAPLWLGYPDGLRPRRVGRFAAAFAGGHPGGVRDPAARAGPGARGRVFAERTLGFQLDRESPFSLWGWGQYHAAGVPDLHLVQVVLEVVLVVLAVALAFVPRRKSPLQLAALTAAC